MMEHMATETRVTLLDDIDGDEGASRYSFAWQGTEYEIDLSDANRDELLRALQPYMTAGRRQHRRASRPRRDPAATAETATIRQWARATGIAVPDRGRLPDKVRQAYYGAR